MGHIKRMAAMLLLIYSVYGSAAVYQCESNGHLKFSDTPCSNKAQIVSKEKKDYRTKKKQWKSIVINDDITGNQACFAASPDFDLGYQGVIGSSTFLQASLRVGGTDRSPWVAIRSKSISSRPATFHNDIHGLGIKVGDHDFIPVSKSLGDYTLTFSSSNEAKIFEEIKDSKNFRVRLRYWPYDETYDSEPIDLNGFAEAFKKAVNCDEGA